MKLKYFYSSIRTFVCLAVIIALLAVQMTNAQLVCQSSGSPATRSDSLTLSDPVQTGRISRDGVPSTCSGKTNVLQNSTPVHYDSYNFTNPTGQPACVKVEIDFTGCISNTTGIVAYTNYNPAIPNANIIGDLGFSSIGVGSFTFPVAGGANFTVVVHEVVPNSGCSNYTFNVSYSTNCRHTGFDLTNDGKADLSMFNPNTGVWRNTNLDSGLINSYQWGIPNDKPVAADFTGDARTDYAVFRPGTGVWWYISPETSSYSALQWGLSEDVPVPGDYDGDNKADISVWRPSDGNWYIFRSSTQTFSAVHWGGTGDIPVPGDYDGDRKNDIAVFRPSTGVWYLFFSNFDFEYFTYIAWGLQGDKPVAADFDGDSRTDLAVYRPSDGTWYYLSSNDTTGNAFRAVRWGVADDIPQPADFDGDKIADFAIYRPSNLSWYILGSATGFRLKQFGENNEIPVTSAFVP